MLRKFLCLIFLLIISNRLLAQDVIDDFGETLKSTLLQLTEEQNKNLLNQLDSFQSTLGESMEFDIQDVTLARRLSSIQNIIPLDYNGAVKKYIQIYSSDNYRPYISKLLGLSKFYFPIYDRIFKEKDLPKEVKYISVIESSLNPHLVSSSGAVGLWQFMYNTARIHNLAMDSFIDERKDPLLAGYAVSEYLSGAYEEFNDWLLALASYNCGRGCVRRAIARSGIEKPSFWQLSPFLPRETQNYIPKFVAMTYILNYSEYYDLKPIESDLNLNYEVIMVDKSVNMSDVAKALNLSENVVKTFNPSYKKNIINGSPESPKRLILPCSEIKNDSLLYLALNSQPIKDPDHIMSHIAQKGETIYSIAKKYNVTSKELIAWNKLANESISPGKELLVYAQNTSLNSVTEINKQTVGSKDKYITYTIRKGDTLSGIASRYKGVTVAKLRADNNIKGSHLSIGKKIRIAMK